MLLQSIVATCHLCKTYWNNEALCSTWIGNVRNFQIKQESMMVRAYSVALAWRPFYGTLTRGDADVLPRAMCFWAFSPRVKRNRDKSTDVTSDINHYTIFQTKKRNRNVKVKSIHYLCNVLSCRAIQRYFVWTCSECGWLWAWSERVFERNGI